MRRWMFASMFMAVALATYVQAQAKSVDVDKQVYAGWYKVRDVKSASKLVQDGYNIVMNTNTTLGPDGNIKDPQGKPYVFSSLACTSCHFGGGQIPGAIPFFQVRDKYASPGVYYRAADVMREVPARINWCLVECANGQFLPEDHYAMKAMVAYVEWVAEGLTDPSMIGKDNWQNIPGHTWPSFKQNVMAMKADPAAGEQTYWDRCDKCHGIQGAGQGRTERGEGRARVPALWGPRSYTKAAQGMYSVPIVSRGIKNYMPLGEADLTEQEALDVAGFINSQPRDEGPLTDTYFGANDPATGIPNSFSKPSYWAVGVPVPGDPFPPEQRLLGPWAPIETWQKERRDAWLAANPK